MTRQLLLIALTQVLNTLTLNPIIIIIIIIIIALSTIHPFQTGMVAHHDKLARVSNRVEARRVYEAMEHCCMKKLAS